jgi:hypothetical protein
MTMASEDQRDRKVGEPSTSPLPESGAPTPHAAQPGAHGPPLKGTELKVELRKYLSERRSDLAFIIKNRRSGASADREKVRVLKESFGSGPVAAALQVRTGRECSHADVSATSTWRQWRNEIEPGRLDACGDVPSEGE